MNKVINGDFTNGLDSWNVNEGTVKVLSEGDINYARLYANAYLIYQRINIDKNKKYTFSCQARISHSLLQVYVGSRRLSKPNDTVRVTSIGVFEEYSVEIDNESDEYLDVITVVMPNTFEPEEAYADLTNVSLTEIQI